jgi:hypothetical protein
MELGGLGPGFSIPGLTNTINTELIVTIHIRQPEHITFKFSRKNRALLGLLEDLSVLISQKKSLFRIPKDTPKNRKANMSRLARK